MNPRLVVGIGLASAALLACIINSIGSIALVFKAGPTPVLSLAAMALAAGAFAVSWKQRSVVIAGLLTVSGIVFMIPALNAMGYSFEHIVFPGPILGVIFGLVILGLGIANGVAGRRTVKAVPS